MKTGVLVVLLVLSILTVASLVLSVVAVLALQRARQVGLSAVRDARSFVTGIEGDVISYVVEVDQDIPLAVSAPVYEEIVVPINTTIPIDTIAVVPVSVGLLGTFDLEVPIRTVVPLNLNVAVPISHTVDVATTVHLDFDVPVEVSLDDTPITGYAKEVGGILVRIEERLADPLGSDGE
jgi:hypothetical protein